MKEYLLLGCFILCLLKGFSQNIGINATGATPDASAMLDVSSISKGFLMPRMTSTQRTAIATPAEGLKVYDTDTKTFWFFNGTGWIQSATGASVNYWALNGTHIFNSNAGNIGIGLNTPLAPLHIKNDNEALRIQGTNPFISFHDNADIQKGFLRSYNGDLLLGTPAGNSVGRLQFIMGDKAVMTLLPFGSMYLGNNTFSNNDFSITRGSNSLGLSVFSNYSQFIANNNIVISPAFGSGYVGINTSSPSNKLQIGSMGATSFATNDLAIGNGTNAMAILQTNEGTLMGSTTDIIFRPRNNGNGYVGINTLTAPTNKLQIGSMGNSGFAGNDLAIGNGTAAMGVYLTNASTAIGTTNDIILMPRNNGIGRVGINTNTPRAPLDVTSGSALSHSYYFYSYFGWSANSEYNGTSTNNPVPDVSIAASGRVYASEFDAYSDARIKDVLGKSNSAIDLQTVNALQITDYTMKDKVKYGNQLFKKVIAQEVEKVYPQVVSKHTDFIPNVYQVSNQLIKTDGGYLLRFEKNHHISNNAKKLQVIMEKGGMQQFAIVGIPSERDVIIKAMDLDTDKLFVYGEEVDDFRTVDYEGLATLNISATQELNKIINKQQKQIEMLERRLAALETRRSSRLLASK